MTEIVRISGNDREGSIRALCIMAYYQRLAQTPAMEKAHRIIIVAQQKAQLCIALQEIATKLHPHIPPAKPDPSLGNIYLGIEIMSYDGYIWALLLRNIYKDIKENNQQVSIYADLLDPQDQQEILHSNLSPYIARLVYTPTISPSFQERGNRFSILSI